MDNVQKLNNCHWHLDLKLFDASYKRSVSFQKKVGAYFFSGQRVCVCVCVCVCVSRAIDREWPVEVRPLLSLKRRARFKTRNCLERKKNIVVGPDGTRKKKDWLCWREPAAIYPLDIYSHNFLFFVLYLNTNLELCRYKDLFGLYLLAVIKNSVVCANKCLALVRPLRDSRNIPESRIMYFRTEVVMNQGSL
jgi:hypothetical protein